MNRSPSQWRLGRNYGISVSRWYSIRHILDLPKLRLPSKFGFGEDAHVDDVRAPRAIHLALCSRRELRALHADDAFVCVHLGAVPVGREDSLYALLEPADELVAERVPERGMGDDSGTLEKACRTDTLGAIDDLTGEDKVSGCDFLAERSYGREGQDRAHTQRLQSSDIRARGNGGWIDSVPNAVTSEKSDLGTRRQSADRDGGTGKSPGLSVETHEKWTHTIREMRTVSGLTCLLQAGMSTAC